jgi:hypothetical protein
MRVGLDVAAVTIEVSHLKLTNDLMPSPSSYGERGPEEDEAAGW